MVKSAIKIFCRVKPSRSKNLVVYNVDEETNLADKSALELFVPKDTDLYINNKKEKHVFGFNNIFDQKTNQDTVFNEVAKGVVDNVLSGYNGTIFAYGQTGSGKTFTITGGVEKYADRGIIPRALSYVFEKYKEDKEKIYTTDISYLEIYNEYGYDLLDPRHEATKLEDLPKVSLMEDRDQNIHLKNMSVITANNEEEALNLLFLGDTNRMVAETPMNQASTRSHCIFTIHITSRQPGSATINNSKLHLVDLAGSERVAKSKVGGQLLTEAKYINLSLHFLEQVIVALSEKKRQHIPYRNSMMTSVLRDSLGGNCMTTMIATISVQRSNIEESISTCKFAQRVAMIKNEAIQNEELDPKLLIARLKREVRTLKDEISLATGQERTDDLNKEEIDLLNDQIESFVSSSDVEAVLDVGGDMRKIQHCFSHLKRLISTNQTARQTSNQPESPDNRLQQNDNRLSLDDAQVDRLREILEQRDNEIAILVDMLKKERMKQSSSRLNSANEAGEPNNMDHAIISRAGTDNSEAKKAAFEIYKQKSENYSKLEDQKQTLKIRYSEAKQLGQKVNNSRNKINHLKNILDQMNSDLTSQNEDDVKEEEDLIRKQIDEWKSKYSKSFQMLKSMKTEIDHLHHILNKSRVQIQNNFEEWWISQQQSNQKLTSNRTESNRPPENKPFESTIDNEKPSSSYKTANHYSSSKYNSSSDQVLSSTLNSEPPISSQNFQKSTPKSSPSKATYTQNDIPLTGDKDTDADILAFVKARQAFINSSSNG